MTGVLADAVAGRQIVVCCGSGGVGKTTTAAAIAVQLAAEGRRVCVCTIDPARRLANSLGLVALGNEPQRVDDDRLAAGGVTAAPGGELWALQLDAKRTFDGIVERYAPDPAARARIMANPVYTQMSSALAGSQEYSAMEKVYELHESVRFELIVLDTPPSRNALDFLEAPTRLTDFLSGRSLGFFLSRGARAGRLGFRLANRGATIVFKVLERVTGVSLLADLSEFFGAFEAMYAGFSERAESVRALLASDAAVFLVVTSPERDPVDEALFFVEQLRETALPFGAAIVNRVHPALATSPADAGPLGDLAPRVAAAAAQYAVLADRDAAGVARLTAALGDVPAILVPHLDTDVHDVAGLAEIDDHLFATA